MSLRIIFILLFLGSVTTLGYTNRTGNRTAIAVTLEVDILSNEYARIILKFGSMHENPDCSVFIALHCLVITRIISKWIFFSVEIVERGGSSPSPWMTCTIIWTFLEQVFSCEFCKIFNNTYFYTTPLGAASVRVIRNTQNTGRQANMLSILFSVFTQTLNKFQLIIYQHLSIWLTHDLYLPKSFDNRIDVNRFFFQ